MTPKLMIIKIIYLLESDTSDTLSDQYQNESILIH